MANTPASISGNPPAVLGRLRIFVVILMVSNLLLGGLSVYLLRSLDDSYSNLIDRNFPLMNALRKLTKETISMQRQVLAALIATDQAGRADPLQKLEEARTRQAQYLSGLLRSDEFRAKPELSHALLLSAQAYESGVQKFRALLAADRHAEADQLRNEHLRPGVNHYLDVIDQAAAAVEDGSQRLNDDYSGKVRTHSTILLGLASWPLMIGLVLTVVVALIIGVLVLVYRQIGTEQY